MNYIYKDLLKIVKFGDPNILRHFYIGDFTVEQQQQLFEIGIKRKINLIKYIPDRLCHKDVQKPTYIRDSEWYLNLLYWGIEQKPTIFKFMSGRLLYEFDDDVCKKLIKILVDKVGSFERSSNSRWFTS